MAASVWPATHRVGGPGERPKVIAVTVTGQ
jgi:hypothetical protein